MIKTAEKFESIQTRTYRKGRPHPDEWIVTTSYTFQGTYTYFGVYVFFTEAEAAEFVQSLAA